MCSTFYRHLVALTRACAWLLLTLVAGCPRGQTVRPATDRAAAAEQVELFRDFWLNPARVAPPTIDFEERAIEDNGLRAFARPLRPEDATWNQWPAAGLRLFNNRAVYLFVVSIEGEGPLQWLPESTHLSLNGGDPILPPSPSPEELLEPLLQAALLEERYVLTGDLVERARAAGPFRAAYLPLSAESGSLTGVIAFPLSDADRHVVRQELVVGVRRADVDVHLAWIYD